MIAQLLEMCDRVIAAKEAYEEARRSPPAFGPNISASFAFSDYQDVIEPAAPALARALKVAVEALENVNADLGTKTGPATQNEARQRRAARALAELEAMTDADR